MSVEIVCNGGPRRIEEGTLLIDFLRSLSLDPETVVVECDGAVVERPSYEHLVLHPGARLELIRFVGGG